MSSVISFTIISILMLIYLIYQSKEDIKDQTVPVLPGYLAIGLSIILYFIGCLCTWSKPDIIGLLIGFSAIFLLNLFKVFGSGDAKAFYAIHMISAFSCSNGGPIFHAEFDIMLLALTYFYATFLFVPVCVVKGIKNKKTIKEILYGNGEKIAFFPYITVGYILTYILYTLANL